MTAPDAPPSVQRLSDTTFHASRLEPDGEYGETFDAADWDEARRICDERGWVLRGRGGYTVYGIDAAQADAMIAALNERDERGGNDG